MLSRIISVAKHMHSFSKSVQNFRRYSQQSINLSPSILEKYFNHLLNENELLLLNQNKSPDEIRRLRKIKSIVNILTQRTSLRKSIHELKNSKRCEEDEEVRNMMEEEYEIYRKREKEIENQLQTVLFEPVLSNSGILVELMSSEGDNASLFVRELLNMYKSYGKFKNWHVEVASIDESDTGLKRASILIEGLGALELMKIEKGVHHRVSDIVQPNRISTVTVSVLLQPTKTEMDVPHEDLTIETKVAQNDEDANSQNYVRVTHTPTGIALTCKSSKSNKVNKYIAIKELNTLLFNKTKPTDQSAEKEDGVLIQSTRIIRTYDFTRDRVMEHRDEVSQHRLTSFLEGGEDLEQLQESLLSRQHHQELLNEISKFMKTQDDLEEEANTPGSM